MSERESPTLAVTLAILAASSLTVMANATISPGLAGLEAHFEGVPNIRVLAGLVVTLPSLFVILFAGVFGWLADRVDRRRLLAVAMLIYAIGGVSGLVLSSIQSILVGRAILGLGVAGTMTLSITLAGDLWQGAARQRFLGLQASSMAGGGAVFITIGGLLASLGWRYPFLVYLFAVPISLMVLATLRRVDTNPGRRAATTGTGAAREVPAFPWRQLGPVYAAAVLFMVTFYLIPTQLPFHLEALGVTSPSAVALSMACMTLVSIPGGVYYGKLRQYVSGLATFAIGFALMGIGLIIISQASGVATVVPGTVVMGLGMGALMPNFSAYIMQRIPDELRGRGSGWLTTSIFGGQFVSPFLSGPVAARVGLPATFVVFGVMILTIAAGVAVAVIRRGTQSPARA